ncbi:MAG: hypothetical protein Q9157_006934 [Trypethelium eluteriae]
MHIYFDDNGYVIDHEDVLAQSPEQGRSIQSEKSSPTAFYYEQKFKQLRKQSQHHQTRTESRNEGSSHTKTLSCTASTSAFDVSNLRPSGRSRSPSPDSTYTVASELVDPGSPSTASTRTIVGDPCSPSTRSTQTDVSDLVDTDSQFIPSINTFGGDTISNADMESFSSAEEDLLDEQTFAAEIELAIEPIATREEGRMNQTVPIGEGNFMGAEADEVFSNMIQEDVAEAVRHLRQLEDFVDFQPWVPLPTPDPLTELEYLMAHRRPKWRGSPSS